MLPKSAGSNGTFENKTSRICSSITRESGLSKCLTIPHSLFTPCRTVLTIHKHRTFHLDDIKIKTSLLTISTKLGTGRKPFSSRSLSISTHHEIQESLRKDIDKKEGENDIHTQNTLIKMYARQNNYFLALSIFQSIPEKQRTKTTYLAMILATSKNGKKSQNNPHYIFNELPENMVIEDIQIKTSLIQMFSACGDFKRAQTI